MIHFSDPPEFYLADAASAAIDSYASQQDAEVRAHLTADPRTPHRIGAARATSEPTPFGSEVAAPTIVSPSDETHRVGLGQPGLLGAPDLPF